MKIKYGKEFETYYHEGDEYTIGTLTDDTADPILWDGNTELWTETVIWAAPDTVGTAIKRAIEQRQKLGFI